MTRAVLQSTANTLKILLYVGFFFLTLRVLNDTNGVKRITRTSPPLHPVTPS